VASGNASALGSGSVTAQRKTTVVGRIRAAISHTHARPRWNAAVTTLITTMKARHHTKFSRTM
jgi:hypothetical protein